MQVMIVGIREGKNKDKKSFFTYYGLKDFSDYDVKNSDCFGKMTVSAFTYKDYGLQVGDLVDFQYEPGYEGKATLSNIVMIKMGSGNPFETEAAGTEDKAAKQTTAKAESK